MTVFLCGFMGCGKTTVGKKLAEISGRGYCDTDELIVKRAGMPIPDIFKKIRRALFQKAGNGHYKRALRFQRNSGMRRRRDAERYKQRYRP